MRVWIVEDEEKLARQLKKGLQNEGYAADYFRDAESLVDTLSYAKDAPDLIILDIGLPDKDGFDLIRELRSDGHKTPILILTARDSETDKVDGLNLGADDYLTKPFSFAELLARTGALLRRPGSLVNSDVSVGKLRLDATKRQIRGPRRRYAALTKQEFAIMEFLMRHPEQVLTRQQILDNAWGTSDDNSSNVVDAHVKNLRKKLVYVQGYSVLEAVRGLGYRLNP